MSTSFFSSGSPSRIGTILLILVGVMFLLNARGGDGAFLWVVGVLLVVLLIRNIRVARLLRRDVAASGGGSEPGRRRAAATTNGIVRVQDPDTLDAVFSAPEALLFKHSVLCGISSGALAQVERFVRESPATPVFQVNVIEDRALSNAVEDRTGVRHESPQTLLLRQGRVVAHMSHGRIRSAALRQLVTDAD